MKCSLCKAQDATTWAITCDGRDQHTNELSFEALPLCEDCRPVTMALVNVDEARRGDDVAMFDFRSGPPDV